MVQKRAEENVHVCVDTPVDKRREILQVAIDTVQLMKRYESILQIRRQKEKEYAEFRRVLGSINRMVKEVRFKELPLDAEDLKHVKAVKSKSILAPIIRKVGSKKEPAKKEDRAHPSGLDRQLDELQRKLQRL